MKKIFLLLPFLLLLISVQKASKTLYFKIKVVDEKGKVLPGCSMIHSSSSAKGHLNGVSDNNGMYNFSVEITPGEWAFVQIEATHRMHGIYYINFRNFEKYQSVDTVKGMITIMPQKKK